MARDAQVSVYASESCVGVNGRPPQRLFASDADLLAYAPAYASPWGASGVGRFLHPWAPHWASHSPPVGPGRGGGPHDRSSSWRCDLDRRADAEELQRTSDAHYRALYGPWLFSRPHKRDWPWVGRSRLPLPPAPSDASCTAVTDADANSGDRSEHGAARREGAVQPPAPSWATVSSYVQAHHALWTPADQR